VLAQRKTPTPTMLRVTGELGRDQTDPATQDRTLGRRTLDAHVAFDFDTLGIDGELRIFPMALSIVAPAIWSAAMVAGGDAQAFDGEVATDMGSPEAKRL
jgi:hypothetical protein